MTKQRPTIKGKGVDFFFNQEPRKPSDQPTRQTAIQPARPIKATFLLPQSLVDRLDDVWLELRMSNRKLQKSSIARIALEELLSDHEKNNQSSKLSNYINAKTFNQQ